MNFFSSLPTACDGASLLEAARRNPTPETPASPAFERAKQAMLDYVNGDDSAAERFKDAVAECATPTTATRTQRCPHGVSHLNHCLQCDGWRV